MSQCHKIEIMGILNVTTDSFSDGGRYCGVQQAIDRAEQMIAEGADWIDVGGESTRPGSEATSEAVELERVIPLVSYLANQTNVRVSVDTNKPAVMQAAIAAGADLINDVRALQVPGALEAVSQSEVKICLMHMQGMPRTMQQQPTYQDVVEDIIHFFRQRLEACIEAGIEAKRIYLDPGFGFGKTTAHNYELLARLREFHALGHPLLVGMSRKNMLGEVTGRAIEQRLPASLTAATLAMLQQAAIIRVHDVAETKDALSIVQAFKKYHKNN